MTEQLSLAAHHVPREHVYPRHNKWAYSHCCYLSAWRDTKAQPRDRVQHRQCGGYSVIGQEYHDYDWKILRLSRVHVIVTVMIGEKPEAKLDCPHSHGELSAPQPFGAIQNSCRTHLVSSVTRYQPEGLPYPLTVWLKGRAWIWSSVVR
jgi:hypothetical protein